LCGEVKKYIFQDMMAKVRTTQIEQKMNFYYHKSSLIHAKLKVLEAQIEVIRIHMRIGRNLRNNSHLAMKKEMNALWRKRHSLMALYNEISSKLWEIKLVEDK
jgi:hypothetical protein